MALWLMGLFVAAVAMLGGRKSGTAAPVEPSLPAPPVPSPPAPVPSAPAPAPAPTVPVSLVEPREDVIFSMMALTDLSWWPWARRPRLIELPGAPGKHPSWAPVAQQLRDGRGALLPALRRQYQISPNSRIAVVGFSAGSNSGLRALLASALDRVEYDFVGSFDGLHLNIKSPPWPAGVLSRFFPDQVDGFADYALAAARRQRGMVITSSSVAAPVVSGLPVSQTVLAQTAILAWVGEQMQRLAPGADPWRAMARAAGDIELPAARVAELARAGGEPWSLQTVGNLVCTASPGANEAAHIVQARVFAPVLLRATLAERWRETVNV